MYAFEKAFKKPNKYSKNPNNYFDLHQQTINSLWKINPIILKIPSHLDVKRSLPNIKMNDKADELANRAVDYKFKQQIMTPLLNEWNWSLAESHDLECGNNTVIWDFRDKPS